MKKNLDFPHPLYEVFGGGSAIILDVFLWLRQYDYSEAEIARKTNLSRKTVSNEIRKLLKKKILKLTRQSGKSRMYLFNDIPENA